MNRLLIVMKIKIEATVILVSALGNVVIIPWLTNYPVFALKNNAEFRTGLAGGNINSIEDYDLPVGNPILN